MDGIHWPDVAAVVSLFLMVGGVVNLLQKRLDRVGIAIEKLHQRVRELEHSAWPEDERTDGDGDGERN